VRNLFGLYGRFSEWSAKLRSPFLSAVRLYWGWQFAQTGWEKLHHLGKITAFFTSLNTMLNPESVESPRLSV
jgi:putative oxidoreductase